MPEIISEEILIDELNHFRYILTNYDFSEVSNIIFYNIESLNHYLKTYKNNPFERQYQEIEASLNKLSPYLPIGISGETIEIIAEVFDSQTNFPYSLKEDLLFSLKLDFIERVKNIKTEDEWLNLLSTCKKLRYEKSQERQKDELFK